MNHYTVLGLPPYGEDDDGVKINKEQIRKAYFCKALKLHPDKNRNDPKKGHEKFRKLKTSYDILIEPKSKELFDNLLRTELEKRKAKRARDEDSEFWNNISENEKEQPKRTQGEPEFWKKVLEEEEEEPSASWESDWDSEAVRHEKETLRELYKQVKQIRVPHANKREDGERFVNDIPKANPRFLFRSMAGFVSYEAMVLRRVQEAAENYKRSSFSEPGLV